ncbi:MAG: glycosyltransferase family 9 protein, partial [Solirubrobacteraceae bacterium]|nr:glycosyltransferase family 9 protein [Solirubrobacteraceae bacterium]
SGAVLVVRFDAIGDFVVWLQAASQLRSAFPGQRIVLAANAVWADLARQLPYWDEVIAIDVKRLDTNLAYRWRTLREVARRGFSTALQPTHSRTLSADAVIRSSGAAKRIGAVGDLTHLSRLQKRIADRWYTRLLPSRATESAELDRNREFMQGLTGDASPMPAFRLPEVSALRDGLLFGQAYAVVFPGASWSGRQWPVSAFGEFINAFCGPRGWLAVICGSPQEESLCAAVAASTTVPSVNLAGQTSLAEFCEVARRSRLLVGNETSAVHIAAAVGVPCVCILGGGHFGRFVPYPTTWSSSAPEPVFHRMPCFGCNWECHLPHVKGEAVPCVSGVSAPMVVEAAARVIRIAEASTADQRTTIR